MREGPNFFFFFDLWIISRVKYIQGTIINKNEENRSGRKSRLSLSLSLEPLYRSKSGFNARRLRQGL